MTCIAIKSARDKQKTEKEAKQEKVQDDKNEYNNCKKKMCFIMKI